MTACGKRQTQLCYHCFYFFKIILSALGFFSRHVRSASFVESLPFSLDAIMFKRRDFIFAVLVIYLVLIILFLVYKEPYSYSNSCMYAGACVRFCCDDHNTCSNKFINANFNSSLVPSDDDNETEVRYLFGRPDCSTLRPLEFDREWQFTSVSRKASIPSRKIYFKF